MKLIPENHIINHKIKLGHLYLYVEIYKEEYEGEDVDVYGDEYLHDAKQCYEERGVIKIDYIEEDILSFTWVEVFHSDYDEVGEGDAEEICTYGNLDEGWGLRNLV